MSAEEALAWLREKPTVKYIYRFFGEWETLDKTVMRKRIVNRDLIKEILRIGGTVYAKKYKLTSQDFIELGVNTFWTLEECEAAIKEELES